MKTISNTLRTEFYRSNFVAVDLIELHLPTPLYLATGGMNIAFDSNTAPTAGTNTYLAQGEFMGFTGLTEDFDVRVGKFGITLSGVGTTYINSFVNLTSNPKNKIAYEGARVVVYKAFLSTTTGALVDTPLLIFDGIIYNVGIEETATTCTISVECSSLFADFERTAGRRTNNGSNWLFQGTTVDTSMAQSGIVGESEFKWGRA